MLPDRRQLASHSIVLFIGLVIGVGIALALIGQAVQTRLTNPTASSSAVPASTTVGSTITEAQLTPQEISAEQDKISKYITVEAALLGVSDNFSLYFKNLNFPEEVGIDQTRSWIPASTIKSFVTLEAFHQRDIGILNFDRVVTIVAQNVVPTELETDDFPRLREGTTATVRQLVGAMIDQSDNTAYNTLLDLLDRRNINATLRRLGLTETVVGEKLNVDDTQQASDRTVPGYQPNSTTAKDLATFFDLIYQRSIPDSDEIMTLFKNQKINNMIPQLLPAGTVVAHKTGDWAPIYHDGGVIYKPDQPFILTIFTNAGSPDVVAKLAQVAYYQNSSVIGKETSLNFSPAASSSTIALTEPVDSSKLLGTSTDPSSPTAADLGISTNDLTSQDQFVRSVGDALILPGSIFYNFKQWLEGVGLNLARNNRQKAEVYLNLAVNRLSEAKTLIRLGHSKEASPILLSSESDLEKAISLAKASPDSDILLARAKELVDLHFGVLKDVSSTISGDKKDFVDTVYQFYQKEHQNITSQIGKTTIISPSEQVPTVGVVTDLTGNQATVKLDNGTEKAVLLTPDTNVRDSGGQSLKTISVLKTGDRVAVVGNVASSGKTVSRFILRNIPSNTVSRNQGVITQIDPTQKTIDIVDSSGQTQVIDVSAQTEIKAKDTTVSLSGIKAGSVVEVFGAAVTPTTTSPSAPTSASKSAVKNSKSFRANSVTIVTNSSGKKEKIEKSNK